MKKIKVTLYAKWFDRSLNLAIPSSFVKNGESNLLNIIIEDAYTRYPSGLELICLSKCQAKKVKTFFAKTDVNYFNKLVFNFK